MSDGVKWYLFEWSIFIIMDKSMEKEIRQENF